NGLFWNPASVRPTGKKNLSFTAAKPFAGLDGVDIGVNSLAFLLPLDLVSTGLSYQSLDADSYKEEKISLSAAIGGKETAAGLIVNILEDSFTLDERSRSDPLFASGNSKRNISFDLGFVRRIGSFEAGIVFKEINRPDLGLKTEDRLPITSVFNLGQQITLSERWGLRWEVSCFIRGEKKEPRAGAELLSREYRFRIGATPDQGSLGLGINHSLLIVDYALIYPLAVRDIQGTHIVSVGVRF
ncbi:MAG TPA: type IX secretion system membrane protein PorP/SprF, partial [bacterium]|nr:type IX secretion system membrane protein PorP/SprF [bacterium]